jgi:hypothetical protein
MAGKEPGARLLLLPILPEQRQEFRGQHDVPIVLASPPARETPGFGKGKTDYQNPLVSKLTRAQLRFHILTLIRVLGYPGTLTLSLWCK